MATYQTRRHKLGRLGEKVVARIVHGETTTHKAPFDVVDFTNNYAYEVKTMSGLSVDLKIHISQDSIDRKRKFLDQYPDLKPVLIAVVIYSPSDIQIYRWHGGLIKSVRVSQMFRVWDGER